MEKLATAPTLHGIKTLIAKYWFTDAEKIRITDEQVFQDEKCMKNFFVVSYRGGFMFKYDKNYWPMEDE